MTDRRHPDPADPRAALQPDIRHSIDQALCPRQPGDEALIARVKERVLGAVAQKSSALHRTVRAAAGGWEPVGAGIERKLLWESADTISCLMRLAPGAVAPRHSHPLDEECVVLEGTLRIGPDLLLHPGDFHVGLAGVDHEDATTETGAVVYLRGARPKAEAA